MPRNKMDSPEEQLQEVDQVLRQSFPFVVQIRNVEAIKTYIWVYSLQIFNFLKDKRQVEDGVCQQFKDEKVSRLIRYAPINVKPAGGEAGHRAGI